MTQKPYELTCEYLDNPIGIDTVKPRLSWKIKAENWERGKLQTAYALLISSMKAHLNQDIGDIWDTGKILSSQSNLTEYDGIDLISGRTYFWKVKVWDEAGQASPWSDVFEFTMGLLLRSDWKGKWISAKASENIHLYVDHIWFRKTFKMDSECRSGYVYIASVGFHELYVNGKKADTRLLCPSQSRIEDGKRVLYVTYDVSGLIQKGENVLALWTAAGWARYISKQTPGFICQAYMTLHSGNMIEIVSDSSWTFSKSASAYLGGWTWGDFGGEIIDANKQVPNWNTVDFNDSKWDYAVEFAADYVISSDMAEGDYAIEEIAPLSISGDSTYVIDMGKNYCGWLEMKLKNGVPGSVVTFKIADKSTEDMTFGQAYQYVFDSSEAGVFSNRFNYFAGRYITIEGLSDKPEMSDIKGMLISNGLRRSARFTCSNPLFNQIYEMDIYTFIVNTINGVTSDCPHRERLGYGETGNSTVWGSGLTNFESAAFYRRMLQNWRDVQRADGYLLHVAPNFTGGGGTAWSSFVVFGTWEVFLKYGDLKILKENYSTIKGWLDFLNSHVEGILLRYEMEEWGFLGDWATPHGDEWGQNEDALLFNNCIYAYIIEIGGKIAGKLALKTDLDIFSARLSELRRNIHDHFYKNEKNAYIDSKQIHLIMPLLTGVTPEDLRDKVFSNLEDEILRRNPFIDTGSSGIPFFLKYLTEVAERNDLIYSCVNKTTYPGYGYFIDQGETTWPEMWDIRDVYGGSRIHTCYTGISGWFIKGIAGIRADGDNGGFKEFILKPSLFEKLSWVKAEYETLYGTIRCEYVNRSEDQKWEVHIEVPTNSTAKLYLPVGEPAGIYEGDVLAQDAEGVQLLSVEKTGVLFALESGIYRFSCNRIVPLIL